jgi:hypothetical protein
VRLIVSTGCAAGGLTASESLFIALSTEMSGCTKVYWRIPVRLRCTRWLCPSVYQTMLCLCPVVYWCGSWGLLRALWFGSVATQILWFTYLKAVWNTTLWALGLKKKGRFKTTIKTGVLANTPRPTALSVPGRLLFFQVPEYVQVFH